MYRRFGWPRRALLRAALGAGAFLCAPRRAPAQTGDPRAQRPQAGDRFVFAGGERKGDVIALTDLVTGQPPLLVVGGAGGCTNASDSRTIQIGAPTVASAANQVFVVGQAPTAMSAITVTDAATPTITAATDLRIRIPASFNMTWNTALTTAPLTGGAASKVSPTVSYEDGGKR